MKTIKNGDVLEISITSDEYHIIWNSLYMIEHFVDNVDFHAVSGFSKDDAIQLRNRLDEAFLSIPSKD